MSKELKIKSCHYLKILKYYDNFSILITFSLHNYCFSYFLSISKNQASINNINVYYYGFAMIIIAKLKYEMSRE